MKFISSWNRIVNTLVEAVVMMLIIGMIVGGCIGYFKINDPDACRSTCSPRTVKACTWTSIECAEKEEHGHAEK